MANIELPKDHEGREIPLDTSEIFIADGTMAHVVKFEYMYYTCDARGSWFVHFNRTSGEHMTLQPCDVYLTPPAGGGKADMGIKCPNCGGQAVCIDKGDVFVCEKGRPLMREARYHCRHCDSTAIFLRKCEPEGVGHDR